MVYGICFLTAIQKSKTCSKLVGCYDSCQGHVASGGPGRGGCFRFSRLPKKQIQHESTRVVFVLCIRVVLFLFLWLSKKHIQYEGTSFFCFFGASKKSKCNKRAQGFCFCFFGAAKKANPIGGHKGCVFAFWGLPKKQIQ